MHDASHYGLGRYSDRAPVNRAFTSSRRNTRRGKFVNGAVMGESWDTVCEQAIFDRQDGAAITNQIRVLSVDEHPLMREGIATVINAQPDMRVVAHASNARAAIQCFAEHMPDVTLMDLRLPDMSGIDAMIAIREKFPEARIMMFTTFVRDTEIRRALAAGARSYVLKSMLPNDLTETIRQVHAGRKPIPPEVATRFAEHLSDDPLSEREVEVLELAMEGNRNRDIAERLFIAEETVKAHIKHIMGKLGANDRTQAVTIAMQRGIIQI
jgi:DNA-binding NarL/FixJ family response regulator